MDFILSFIDKIGVVLVLKMMLAEFLVGAVIGIGKKELARLQAVMVPTKRVFSAKDYTSTSFGRDLPRGAFNPLALAPSLVVVDYDNDQVRQETFYSPLGDHTSFVDGRSTLIGASILSSPTYLMIATLPMLLGFLGALLLFWVPLINKYASSYLISGLAWNMLMLIIPIFVYRTWENNTTSE
jgi:cellulose synthase/poly-beta-1,6-N-acetylglucosamine synthase-like glycosyltransferase